MRKHYERLRQFQMNNCNPLIAGYKVKAFKDIEVGRTKDISLPLSLFSRGISTYEYEPYHLMHIYWIFNVQRTQLSGRKSITTKNKNQKSKLTD